MIFLHVFVVGGFAKLFRLGRNNGLCSCSRECLFFLHLPSFSGCYRLLLCVEKYINLRQEDLGLCLRKR